MKYSPNNIPDNIISQSYTSREIHKFGYIPVLPEVLNTAVTVRPSSSPITEEDLVSYYTPFARSLLYYVYALLFRVCNMN